MYTTDMTEQLKNIAPHYTNTQYNKAQTVFLRDGYEVKEESNGYYFVSNAMYAYSDRFEYHKREAARNIVDLMGVPKKTAAWFEKYLQLVLENESIKLVHILAGVNLGNEYPYQVFGYVIE